MSNASIEKPEALVKRRITITPNPKAGAAGAVGTVVSIRKMTAAHDSTLYKLKFDLLQELHAYKPSEDEEEGMMTLYDFPVWIVSDIRQLVWAPKYSEQLAMSLCIRAALERLHAIDDKRHWIALSIAARCTKQKYADDEDSEEVVHFLDHFPFTITDNHGDKKTRSLRLPKSQSRELSAVAPRLGIAVSKLAQILIIDGLRSQADVQHEKLMTTTVETFYRKVRKRLMKLAGLLEALEIPLCDDVRAEIDCVRSGQPHTVMEEKEDAACEIKVTEGVLNVRRLRQELHDALEALR